MITPYCAGGDLRILLSRTGPLPTYEADCVVAQMLHALSFLHDHGTAHRDLRLETVLLTAHGAVKLAGFGDGHIRRLWTECAVSKDPEKPDSHARRPGPPPHTPASWSFSLPWRLSSFSRPNPPGSTSKSSTATITGSSLPYIPPEGFHNHNRSHNHSPLHSGDEQDEVEERHDPRPVDIWATAVIYMALITGRLPWRSARPHHEDGPYLEYLCGRNEADGYPPIEALGSVSLHSLELNTWQMADLIV